MNKIVLSYIAKKKKIINKALKRYLSPSSCGKGMVAQAMRYSVFNGGKRLRPILVIASGEACGSKSNQLLLAGCAIEMIHNYSLIHDDLPALDNDDFRRGNPSCHRKFREDVAILAGDALLTRAFEVLAHLNPYDLACKVTQIVSEAIGVEGMIGGQWRDLESEGLSLRRETKIHLPSIINYIHRKKTATLFKACTKVGALIARTPPNKMRSLEKYGEKIGLAFQIRDDILDIKQDKKGLKKRKGSPGEGKLTYPAVFGEEASKKKVVSLIQQAQEALIPFKKRSTILSGIADYISEREN